MTREPNAQTARRLYAGLNGDADQRASTALLAGAGFGVWLGKLAGWPQYLRPLDDARHPDGLSLDWHQLREDLIGDGDAWAAFNEWSTSYTGRRASDDEYERHLAIMVPRRPWHGASSSELVLLRIALELAPGGLLGDGIARLDAANAFAVIDAIQHLASG